MFGIICLFLLPERVASHFGARGEPNDWMESSTNFALMFLLSTVIFIMFAAMPRFMKRIPKCLINLPNKEFWLREENLTEFERRVSNRFYQYGSVLLVFFLCLSLLAFFANYANPIRLRADLFWILFTLFIAYTVTWVAQFFRALALPHHTAAPQL